MFLNVKFILTDMNQGVNTAIYSREMTLEACVNYMLTKKANRELKARWPELEEQSAAVACTDFLKGKGGKKKKGTYSASSPL